VEAVGVPEVRLRGRLKELAGTGAQGVGGATIAESLQALEAERPALDGWILDERGLIRRHLKVFVNGVQGDEATAVGDGDQVEVVPAISGG
jgi:sulfur-carrier protein